jgi:hypothetical protein
LNTLDIENLVAFKNWKDHHEEEEEYAASLFNPKLTMVFISLGDGEYEKKWGYEFSTEFISLDEFKKMIVNEFKERGINLKLCIQDCDQEVGLLTFKAV